MVKRWDRRGRSWNNDEVHFFWDSPVAAMLLLAVLAFIMAVM